MLFTEFTQKMVEELNATGTGSFKSQDITRSSGETYCGIVCSGSGEGVSVSPVIHADALYKEYIDGASFESLLDKAKNISRQQPRGMNLAPTDITSWYKVKDFIYPRLVPDTGINRSATHVRRADLLVQFAVRVFVDSDGLGEALVRDELLDTWNVSLEELEAVAFDNLAKDEFKIDTFMGQLNVLTNKYKVKGAVEMLNPVAMAEVIDKLGDVYILPSSVDEVILMPKDQVDDVNFLKGMVQQVNDTAVEEKDLLSYNIYEYDKENETVVVVA